MRKKALPKFENEQQEDDFWQLNDSSEYIDWDNAQNAVFSQLKPTTKSISIRLPVSLIENVKRLANKRDVPYQSLLKLILEEGVSKETEKNW